jgi:hypothetical protein
MLYGFAIENYCKALLAMRLDEEARERLRSEGRFPSFLDKHDVLKRARLSASLSLRLHCFVDRHTPRGGLAGTRWPRIAPAASPSASTMARSTI